MSIASEITSMGENLKKDYQSIANLGADLTNVDKNIENISSLLDGVYDTLPKTSFQEGTSVTIEGGLKGKIDFDADNGKKVVGKGDTEQATRQYIDVGTWEQGSIDGTTGATGDSNSFVRTKDFIDVKPNVLYKITRTIVADYMVFRFYDSSKNYLGNQSTEGMVTTDEPQNRMAQNDPNMSMTINNTNVAYMKMVDASNDLSTTYTIYTDDTPSPSYPQNINVVTGTQDVVVSGKNKLKFSDVTLESHGVTLQIKDNYFILNGTNDGTESAFNISQYMAPFAVNSNTKLKAFQISGTVTGSVVNPFFRTYTDWKNQVNVSFISSTISDYSVEATYNTSIIGVIGGTFNNYKIGFMVADNLTSGDAYEPYHTPITYPISLGSNKLYGLTNTYKDMFVTDRVTKKWYISRDIDEVVLDRTMRWNSPATYQYNVSDISPYMLASNDGSTSKCNYFVSVQSFATDSDFRNYISSNNLDNVYDIHMNGSGIRFWTTKFSTLEAFLTWLDSVNLKVLVVRPDILTEVTDTTLIEQLENWYNSKSFFGTTIIESNGDLPMIIKVRALKGE